MTRTEFVPAGRTRITGGFWQEKQKLMSDVTVRAIYDRFEETGRFAALSGHWEEGMPEPHIFWDSDTAKWLEGAAYLLMQYPDPEIERRCDGLIARALALQAPDGYINSCYQAMKPDMRFTDRSQHELYCLGHWIEAGVAYDLATGKKDLLHMCERYVALVDRIFRVENSAAFETPGHEEIELALYKLYRHTGKEEYMRLMRYFIDTRGNGPKDAMEKNHMYNQSDRPVRRLETCDGHSVRAMYLYCAMADQAAQDGDEELKQACLRLFENCTRRRMYVTGGIGSTHIGEAFTEDWDLPNAQAYAETCASLGLALFAKRMLRLERRGAFMDTAEIALFNGALSGLSLSGDSFFYENPLSWSPRYKRTVSRYSFRGDHQPIGERVKVFSCSCCPPNVLRVYGSLQEFLYSQEEDGLTVHMFAASEAATKRGIIRQETDYPRENTVRILPPAGQYTLRVRIPAWCKNTRFTLNMSALTPPVTDGYAALERCWQEGDTLEILFDMPVRALCANPLVSADAGRVCLMKGPVVYCLESADNGSDLADLWLQMPLEARCEEGKHCGLPVITAKGSRAEDCKDLPLYSDRPYARKACEMRFIPFYAWANRGENEMTVWVHTGT